LPGMQPNSSSDAVLFPLGFSPGSPADPVNAAIEAHRKARAASRAASTEIKRLCDLTDEITGPREIDIPSLIEPGMTVRASIWLDIEAATRHQAAGSRRRVFRARREGRHPEAASIML
jgi:hypothetical protein